MIAYHHNVSSILKQALIALGCLVLPILALADHPRVFERFGPEAGLSQTNIFAMTEDSRGYLWIGTEFAADRYDGYQFQSLRHQPLDSASLTPGAIIAFHNDQQGRLWIGTTEGVAIYNPDDGSVQRILDVGRRQDSPLTGIINGIQPFCDDKVIALFANIAYVIDPDTLDTKLATFKQHRSLSKLASFATDSSGQFWLTNGHHLWVSNCETQELDHVSSNPLVEPINNTGQSALATIAPGKLAWAGPNGIQILNTETHEEINLIQPKSHGQVSNYVLGARKDMHGNLWVLQADGLSRVVLGAQGHEVLIWERMYNSDLDLGSMERHSPLGLAHSSDGLIWISVPNMLGAFDINDSTFHSTKHDPRNSKSIPPTLPLVGYDLYSDRFGSVWIGSKLGGLARYSPERHRFLHIRNTDSSSYVVRGVAEQTTPNNHTVWIGLDSGGIELWQAYNPNDYHQVPITASLAGQPVDLERIRVRALAAHPKTGAVWFNGVQYFGEMNADERTVKVIASHPQQEGRRRSLAFSKDGQALYQSIGYNLVTHRFNASGELISSDQLDWLPQKINESRIEALYVLPDNSLLLATDDRLFKVLPMQQDALELAITDTDGQKPSIKITSVFARTMDRIWLGTHDSGLLKGQIKSAASGEVFEVAQAYGLADGLPDVTIYAMTKDNDGYLWFSSNKGLSRFNASDATIVNFDVDDGLQSQEFNKNVVHASGAGRLYFGGINGVNVFDPNQIQTHPVAPETYLHRFEVNRKEIEPDSHLKFRYDQNNWSLEYVGLHWMNSEDNRFSYRLEGVDSEWVDAGNDRVARYAGLNPGNYRFWLRAANADGVWSEPKVLLEAEILPPPWQSSTAFFIYILAIAGIMTAFIFHSKSRQQALQALVNDRTYELKVKNDLMAKQSHELEQALDARTLFFANVSHELRTPLTLIDANLASLLQQHPDQPTAKTARHYLGRLSHLVDQLLDLSAVRFRGTQPEKKPWSLSELARSTLFAYDEIARKQNIDLKFHQDGHWDCQVNQSTVEKILLNLITNAIKYTKCNGSVTVTVEQDNESGAWIHVADTGPGIPDDDQANIFERFYRVPAEENHRTSGTGIGLALVTEGVRAIGGAIRLTSQVGKGSTFSVWLPAHHDASTRKQPADDRSPSEVETSAVHSETRQSATDQSETPRQGRLLIVEDNADLREILVNALCKDWQITEAADGEQALAALENAETDLILSDIMMPNMDGLSLLQHVRDDLRFSHLPFLFLTARSDDETELQSLMLAADDFVRKPFNQDVLRLKLRNMHQARIRLQTQLGHIPRAIDDQHEVTGARTNLSARDQRFVESLTRWLEKHATEPSTNVGALAGAMAIDERTLQRKFKALFGQKPLEYIHQYRVYKACQLLRDGNLSIQQVAYETGFNDPRYFSKIFTKIQGTTPSRWRKAAKSV